LTNQASEVWAMIDEVTLSRWLIASAGNAVDRNQGQYALELASAAVKAAPSNPIAHYQLGRALFGQGDLQGAVASLNKALALTDSSTFGCDIHERIATYFLAKGKPLDAVPRLRESVRCDPESASIQFKLINALVETGQYEEARELLRNPDNKLFGTAMGYIGLSLIAQQSDPNQARHWLEMAKQSAPTDPEVEYSFGLFEASQLHHDQAVLHFESAKQLGLSEARVDLAIARSCVILEDFHCALLAYKNVTDSIGNQKRLVGLWVERGEFLSSLPEYQDEAKRVWLKVLEIDPTNDKAKSFLSSQ
jgi:tetratricopeptide (TPR) repeat protein